MAVKITESEMTSDITPHAAQLTPDGWIVTWLPAPRALTYNQAITAMTIAEVVAGRDPKAALPGPVMLHVEGWADELGLSAAGVVAMTSAAPAADEGADTDLATVTADEHGSLPPELGAPTGPLPWILSDDKSRWTAALPDGRTAVIERLLADDGTGTILFMPVVGGEAGPACAGVLPAANWAAGVARGAAPEPRANRHGSPCPPWCTTDHAPRTITTGGRDFDATIDSHWNTADTVTVLAGPGEGGHALAYAYQSGLTAGGTEAWLIIDAHADRNGQVVTRLEPTAADACGIAGMVEALAHATPEQHLQLAAQLRAAASIVTFGEAP